MLSSLQSPAAACHVKWLQIRFHAELCNMHKITIFTVFSCQKVPKIAQNWQLQISIFPTWESWFYGLGSVFWMVWSSFPPNIMTRYLWNAPPCLLSASYFSWFLRNFYSKKQFRQQTVNTCWPKIFSWNEDGYSKIRPEGRKGTVWGGEKVRWQRFNLVGKMKIAVFKNGQFIFTSV